MIWAPDDEWSYHSKHVEQFTNINKLYIVVCACVCVCASCWTTIDIYFTMHGPSNILYLGLILQLLEETDVPVEGGVFHLC
jgi:hypothetical protein